MKKLALILTTLLVATTAFADEAANKNTELTLAAAELSAKTTWVETKEDAELRINQELAEKADDMNAKINAKLEKQLEEKLAAKLDF